MIAEGYSLYEICDLPHIPHYSTVMTWVLKHDEFHEQYRRARETQPDAFLDWGLGNLRRATSKDEILAETRRLEGLVRLAEKLAPKKYGNRLELSGSLEMKMSDDELESRAAELLRKAGVGIAVAGDRAAQEAAPAANGLS